MGYFEALHLAVEESDAAGRRSVTDQAQFLREHCTFAKRAGCLVVFPALWIQVDRVDFRKGCRAAVERADGGGVDVVENDGRCIAQIEGGRDGSGFATDAGSATEGVDYVGTSGTLTFPANDSNSQTITVLVSGDTDVESNEIFFIDLSNAIGSTISDSQAQGTIIDDDIVARRWMAETINAGMLWYGRPCRVRCQPIGNCGAR